MVCYVVTVTFVIDSIANKSSIYLFSCLLKYFIKKSVAVKLLVCLHVKLHFTLRGLLIPHRDCNLRGLKHTLTNTSAAAK